MCTHIMVLAKQCSEFPLPDTNSMHVLSDGYSDFEVYKVQKLQPYSLNCYGTEVEIGSTYIWWLCIRMDMNMHNAGARCVHGTVGLTAG